MDREFIISIIFAVFGIALGYIAFLINQALPALGMAVVAYIILYTIAKAIMKIEEDFKWWLGNSGVVFFILWLVTWTIFYNLQFYTS